MLPNTDPAVLRRKKEDSCEHLTCCKILLSFHERSTMDTTPKDERRELILHIIQPGLEGLMDGSVSSLAPLSAPPSPPKKNPPPFLSVLPLRSAPGSAWLFRKRCPTMAN